MKTNLRASSERQGESVERTGGVSRRGFLTGAAAAGAALMGGASLTALAGCTPGTKDGAPAGPAASSTDSVRSTIGAFLTPPAPITEAEISETVETEVVIVGAGVAGLNAARAAAEEGAKVVVIEKAETYQYRSGQYGCPDSKVMKDLGMEFDTRAAVNDLQKEMGYRCDSRLLNRWADESGAAFDWMVDLAGDKLEVIPMTALSYNPDKITIQPLHWPNPPAYDIAKEYSPVYPSVVSFLPDQGGILELVYQRCLELGVEFRFATWARQLIRPGNTGRVEGVICQDIDNAYAKITASKGVILAGGDWGSNRDMLEYYVPWALDYLSIFFNMDAAGKVTNTGDCQQMGIWAGAKMEDGPHAPMTHTLGTILGTDPFFLANADGKRFVNEDVGGQQLSSQLFRQKDWIAWQIFDDKYPEQLGEMPCSHGNVNYVVPESENPHMEGAEMTIGKTAFISREQMDSDPTVIKAGTLEELVTKLDLTPEAQSNLLAEIERYNGICASGKDTDFGKDSRRLFPISTAPFYATLMPPAEMLVCMGGLTVDPETLRVVDNDFNPIEGLYAAGNAMGGRIVCDYPVVVAGISHATALVFGRLAGMGVAKA
jgi:succinate dehydrogenase/fumarate reductase flavoprotein subunit